MLSRVSCLPLFLLINIVSTSTLGGYLSLHRYADSLPRLLGAGFRMLVNVRNGLQLMADISLNKATVATAMPVAITQMMTMASCKIDLSQRRHTRRYVYSWPAWHTFIARRLVQLRSLAFDLRSIKKTKVIGGGRGVRETNRNLMAMKNGANVQRKTPGRGGA